MLRISLGSCFLNFDSVLLFSEIVVKQRGRLYKREPGTVWSWKLVEAYGCAVLMRNPDNSNSFGFQRYETRKWDRTYKITPKHRATHIPNSGPLYLFSVILDFGDDVLLVQFDVSQ